jgi:hypothetical protein
MRSPLEPGTRPDIPFSDGRKNSRSIFRPSETSKRHINREFFRSPAHFAPGSRNLTCSGYFLPWILRLYSA